MQKEAEIIAELREENRYLKQELASLKSLFWGKKSERSIVPDTQATLSFGEDIVIANPSPEKKKEKVENTPEPGSKAPVRKPIPDHIPRVDVVLEPENVDLSKYEKIRDEVTEILDYVKSKIVVKRIIRPIYRLIENNGEPNLICANLPAQPVSKSNASASLVAHILICKYADHTPLHRQLKQFLREGIDLAESTVNGWVHKHIKILEPLYELAKKMVQNGHYIMADETPMPVLSADKIGSTHKGYFWVYYAPLTKALCFEYDKSRGQAAPDKFLSSFSGYLQVDGYGGYDHFEKSTNITLVGCMAHARRKFKDAQKQSQPGAEAVLKMFGELYRIEKHARESGMQPKERLKLRQNESVPVMDDLYQFMLTWIKSPEYLPKSLMGKAISYTLNLWKRLNEFTKDGEIEIDNNWIENKIRVVALGRKNYMFAGSHEAAQRSAMMYSFLGMCALEDINPQIWLEDVLTRINNHHINKLDELLPYNWKKLSSPNLEEINL